MLNTFRRIDFPQTKPIKTRLTPDMFIDRFIRLIYHIYYCLLFSCTHAAGLSFCTFSDYVFHRVAFAYFSSTP